MAIDTRTTRERPPGQGSYGAGGGDGHRKRGGWLWWLLGLLALLVIGALLIGLLGGDDDSDNQGAQATATAESGTSQSGAGAAAGSLSARDTSLLPVPAGGLGGFEAETATGRQVTVQSVIDDEGFWVGTSRQERVYVEYGGDVGEDETQGFEAAVGDSVDLTGEIRPAPENPGRTLNLPAADARQVSEQGAYINAATAEVR